MEKFKLKNGKTAVIRKKLHEGSYVAYYSGEEGETLFLVNDEQIKNSSSYPYLFWDVDNKKKRVKK